MIETNLKQIKGGSTSLSLVVLAFIYACLVFSNPSRHEFQKYIINELRFTDKSFLEQLVKSVVTFGLDTVLSCNNYYAFTICEIEKNWITGSLGIDVKLLGVGGKIFYLKEVNPKFKKTSSFITHENKMNIESEEDGFRNAIEKELEK